MKKRLNILFQCDNNFAFMAGVAFSSLVINASERISYYIYVLTPDMSVDNREKYYKAAKMRPEVEVNLTFLDAKLCEEEVKSWNVPSHRGSWVTYYKLLLDRYFKDICEVEQILHIGADTLVTGTLEELVDFDFQNQPFAMNWNEQMRFPRYPKDAQYCIAEMIYFNLPQWREHRCEERILEHVKKFGDIFGSKDQGILCTKFIGEYAQLPLKYNIYGMSFYFTERNRRYFNNAKILSVEDIDSAYRKPEIIHIARTFLYRPCENGSLDRLHDMWWEYCDNSPWKGMKPIQPNPPLNRTEKIFRLLFQIMPMPFAERLYIWSRRAAGNFQWLLWNLKKNN